MEIHKPKFVKGLVAEIFVIVVGISLAVLAERLVEHFQHRREAKGVITRMIAELRRDSIDLEYNLSIHTKAAIADSILTSWSRHEIELPADSIISHADFSLRYTFFASNTAEIEALKGSGKLYLIENEELLSTILKHYDRYLDFKLFTDAGAKICDQLMLVYKSNAQLNTVMDFTGKQPTYQFDASALLQKTRGNQFFENTLQEKRVLDVFTLQRTRSALKRTVVIMKKLQEEMN